MSLFEVLLECGVAVFLVKPDCWITGLPCTARIQALPSLSQDDCRPLIPSVSPGGAEVGFVGEASVCPRIDTGGNWSDGAAGSSMCMAPGPEVVGPRACKLAVKASIFFSRSETRLSVFFCRFLVGTVTTQFRPAFLHRLQGPSLGSGSQRTFRPLQASQALDFLGSLGSCSASSVALAAPPLTVSP